MDNQKQNQISSKIDLYSLLMDVLRQWWVILLIGLSFMMLADLWTLSRYKPQYTTRTTFVVSSNGLNTNMYDNLDSTKKLASRFSQVLDSTILKDRVRKDLGLKTFDAETTVEVIEKTNMLEVTVKADSAAGSYQILQSIMKNYDFVSEYVIGNAVLETLEAPVIAEHPDNPLNEKGILIKYLIYGLVGAAVFIGVLSYLRDTVKNEAEFKSKIDAKLLGTVYHENKRIRNPSDGYQPTNMLIGSPLRSFRFVESNKMTAARTLSEMEKHDAKILLMTSVMENEGKSTVAANMALSFAMEQKKVLLIDCDFRKPALYKIFRIPEEDTIHLPELMEKKSDYNEIISRWKDTNLYTIFNSQATSLESLLENGIIKKILSFCADKMDYIIVDSSPMALVSDTEELAQMADGSVLVVHQDMVLSKDINDAIDILNNTRGKVLGCVFNDVIEGFSSGQAYGYSGYSGYGRGYGSRYGRGYGGNYHGK